ncbi:hypothetical protein [Luteibacter sp. SG786]|uniref:hypothetical protein n=1 Tax=Luteibacter sp. SG786 TaxID=2587130 RepID=UPI0014217266|nr:hypothetical protein [Luteibacter sp. SG786]NII54387.1 hypothetical protein [Luteibacter sp. SG786]
MTAPMDFFWRDIQTVKGAIRAALALPHVDIGELRQVQASGAYTIDPEPPSIPSHEPHRLTIKDARAMRTKAWHDNPPSIAELFALPILSRVAM